LHHRRRYPFISPDNKKVFYNARPITSNPPNPLSTEIWYVEREGDSWSEPKEVLFGEEYKGKRVGIFPTVASNGNLYFAIFPDGKNGDICVSRFENGKYSSPEILTKAIQSHGNHPYIAPDESYLIFDWVHPEVNFGKNDLLISFRDKNGEWMKSQNLGESVNSPFNDWRPFVTVDGKYLFFSSNRIRNPQLPDRPLSLIEIQMDTLSVLDGNQHIFWVDAQVIEELKPEYLK